MTRFRHDSARYVARRIRVNEVYVATSPSRIVNGPDMKVVACPTCEAEIGKMCHTVGNPENVHASVHDSRKRMALRWHRANPSEKPVVEEKKTGVKALGPDEEGVVCPDCGTKVRAIQDGRPTSHAPGGFKVNIRKDLFQCSSSGQAPRN
jgi:hypothetical protein